MKYLIVVFLFTSLNTLDAQNLNFRIEGGTSLIGTQTDIHQGSQNTNYSYEPNIGLRVGYILFKGKFELMAGCSYQKMASSYRYDSALLTGIEKNFPKIKTYYDILRIPFAINYNIKINDKWSFVPVLGGAYCIIMNDTEAFSGHSGRMTRKKFTGQDAVLDYDIYYHNIRSNNVSLDYGFTIERSLSRKWAIYFNTLNQYYFYSTYSQVYFDNLNFAGSDSPGVLTTKSSTLSFNIGVKRTIL